MKHNIINFVDNQYIIGIILASILIVSLLLLLYVILKKQTKKHKFFVIQELEKAYSPEKAVIPLNIFQTWHTKDLPKNMAECVEKLKEDNPEFEHFLFDDYDCREFIKQYFKKDVLDAFDTLIPGAYKADLWRLCVLYIRGGIYMDIKMECRNNFKLKYLTMSEHFVKDRIYSFIYYFGYYYGIYNAFMVCKAKNPFLMRCIRIIVKNVKNRNYGVSPLDPTGPMLLGREYKTKNWNFPLDMYHSNIDSSIIYKNISILSPYKTYRIEQKKYTKNKYYGELWKLGKIYKNNTTL